MVRPTYSQVYSLGRQEVQVTQSVQQGLSNSVFGRHESMSSLLAGLEHRHACPYDMHPNAPTSTCAVGLVWLRLHRHCCCSCCNTVFAGPGSPCTCRGRLEVCQRTGGATSLLLARCLSSRAWGAPRSWPGWPSGSSSTKLLKALLLGINCPWPYEAGKPPCRLESSFGLILERAFSSATPYCTCLQFGTPAHNVYL